MSSFLLHVLDLFKPIFLWQKINYVQLRSIIGVKLEMDNRRSPSFQQQRSNEETSYTLALTFFVFAILGGLISFLIGYLPSTLLSFSIYHAYLMMMITLTLISDFSSVLLDTSDNTILLPRPIDSKTFYAARATHIFLYLIQIGLALSIFPIIVTFIIHGFSAGLFTILATFLNIFFSVSLTNGLYLLLMRFTSEEKLKSIINYFQIGMTIFMMLAYQVLPRLLSKEDLTHVATELNWWFVFIPPMWMAGATKFFIEFNTQWLYLLALILCIAVPFASWKAVNKYLAPYFASKISDLGISTRVVETPVERTGANYFTQLTNWITKPGIERATFTFMRYAFARDRKLKLRVYPAIGSFFVIVAVIFLQGKTHGDTSWLAYFKELPETKIHLVGIYACIFVLVTVFLEINFSDDYKSAWIFKSSPIEKPGEILVGVFKAVMINFYLPLYGFISLIILLVWKDRAITDLLFGFVASWFLLLLMSVLGDKRVPFSQAPTARNQAGNIALVIFLMILIGIIAASHYFLASISYLFWVLFFVLLLASYFLFDRYRKTTWDRIQ